MKRRLAIRRSGPRVSLIAASILAVAASPTLASTWRVATDGSGDFTSVQSAITAAQSGDSVLVAPGTYLENIRFAGRDIVLKSTDGPEATILDGSSQPRSVIEFMMGESNACIIQGFTITGGNVGPPTCSVATGAGIYVDSASPTILGNIVEGNVASSLCGGFGAGILVRAVDSSIARPRIVNNVVRNNVATGNGGGISIVGNVIAEIQGNEIAHNTVQVGDGAGIWCLRGDGTVIADNLIHHNFANDHGGGIYIAGGAANSNLTILRNVIYENSSGSAQEDSGGGIWIANSDSEITNNTIVANRCRTFSGPSGGAIAIAFGAHPIVERNIIALTHEGGGIYCDTRGSTITAANNLVWGNADGDGVGTCPTWFVGNGNLIADPIFCNAEAFDFSLPPNSPALTHPSGSLGARPGPGCSVGVLVRVITWGLLKATLGQRK